MLFRSLGVGAAHYAGYQVQALLPPCVCFHIEHSYGSGWTPEGGSALFDRLEKANILNPDWQYLRPILEQMRKQQKPLCLTMIAGGLNFLICLNVGLEKAIKIFKRKWIGFKVRYLSIGLGP